jgi:hypothetical protein
VDNALTGFKYHKLDSLENGDPMQFPSRPDDFESVSARNLVNTLRRLTKAGCLAGGLNDTSYP